MKKEKVKNAIKSLHGADPNSGMGLMLLVPCFLSFLVQSFLSSCFRFQAEHTLLSFLNHPHVKWVNTITIVGEEEVRQEWLLSQLLLARTLGLFHLCPWKNLCPPLHPMFPTVTFTVAEWQSHLGARGLRALDRLCLWSTSMRKMATINWIIKIARNVGWSEVGWQYFLDYLKSVYSLLFWKVIFNGSQACMWFSMKL